ncbi:MAG: hypothetical protein GY909_17650 [Oligoflexia bacterium]|nr:hypothetical protein [Oligoflexia bacterium]
MFSRILIENDLKDHPTTKEVLSRFKNVPVKYIQQYDQIFGKVKKPYLQKRENLQLFLAKKKGTLIKEAPDAYGLLDGPHYYFIHAYNCIYECEYCYLQGYFHSPDIVLFVNYEEIMDEMRELAQKTTEKIWFHAGEFSDSLALSHITGEIPKFYDFFKKYPHAHLELRTKSANVKPLLSQTPLPNIITSFSLGPEDKIQDVDLKTPPLKTRLKAMKSLEEMGHPIGIHFDPVINSKNIVEDYENLFETIKEYLTLETLHYVSIGVVRFTADVFHQVQKNYPDSKIHQEKFIKSFDNKVRYPRPFRLWLLSKLKDLAIKSGIQEDKIYLCME